MKKMKDNQNLYLKCHVLLPADLFEKCMDRDGSCASHYLSAPAISYDAMLIMIKIVLKLISDADMYSFFEKGIKNGVSF